MSIFNISIDIGINCCVSGKIGPMPSTTNGAGTTHCQTGHMLALLPKGNLAGSWHTVTVIFQVLNQYRAGCSQEVSLVPRQYRSSVPS